MASKLNLTIFRKLFDDLTFEDQVEFLKSVNSVSTNYIWKVNNSYGVIVGIYFEADVESVLKKFSQSKTYKEFKRCSRSNGLIYCGSSHNCVVCNQYIHTDYDHYHGKEQINDEMWNLLAQKDMNNGTFTIQKHNFD